MPERKRREDLENPTALDLENDSPKNDPIEIGAGCAISMDYEEGNVTVYVKTYGEVDALSLRRRLEQNCPGAKIEGLTTKAPTRMQTKQKTKTSHKKPHK